MSCAVIVAYIGRPCRELRRGGRGGPGGHAGRVVGLACGATRPPRRWTCPPRR